MYSLSRKKALHTSRYARKIEKRRKFLYWLLLVLFLSIVAGAITILRTKYLRIDSIVVTGASLEKNSQIQTQIEKIAADSYFYLIPKDTVFTFPLRQFTRDLLDEEPGLASLTIERKGIKTLNVSITLREPVAISCPNKSVSEDTSDTSGSSELESETELASSSIESSKVQIENPDSESIEDNAPLCKFLDANAFAYAPAPSYSPGVYVTFYATNTVAIGKHIEDAKTYQEFLQFSKDVKAYGGVVESVVFEPGEEYEVRTIFGQASSTVKIFFNNRIPLALSIDRAIKLIDSKYLAHKTGPGKTPPLWQLEYIDGRYGPTVYYKYR